MAVKWKWKDLVNINFIIVVFVTGTRRNPISIRWPEGWESVFCSFWWIRTNSAFDGFCKKNNLISLSLWNVRSTKNISLIHSCNKFHEFHQVLPNMNCLRCRFGFLAYCSIPKPCLKPLKYFLSQRFTDHSDWIWSESIYLVFVHG